MTAYRIMTFDGGGVRGVLTAKLLQRLAERFPTLIKKTDLFAGTSTGSFIALGLAYGMTPQQLVGLYTAHAKYIFTPSRLELFRPKYSNQHLKEVLAKIFPADLRLQDLHRQVLIPSFLLSDPVTKNWRPAFFNNFPDSPTREERVIDVALASSAAPVYFPSYRNHIDGGVIANNPSTAAIAFARDRRRANKAMDDIVLLSIGTGQNPQQITANTTRWGALDWALNYSPTFPLLSVLLDGSVETDTYISSRMLGDRFFRLNPTIKESIALDDYKKIPALISLGEQYDLTSACKWLDQYWM